MVPVAHEMGHYFQFKGSRTGGDADVLRSFYRDEYADRTCIMGSDRFAFTDALIVAPLTLNATTLSLTPIVQRTGPRMCAAQADRCGWLEPGTPGVAVVDPHLLGRVTLRPWTGAPPREERASFTGPPGAAGTF
jgi:hypothetical protein